MTYSVITPPAVQCVSYAEAMSHLRLIGTDDDDDVALKLAGAIRIVERKCGPIAQQTIRARYDAMPSTYRLLLPAFRAQSVLSVMEDENTVLSSDYSLEQTVNGAVVKLSRALDVPITVDAVVGWSVADVPADLKAAVLIMLGHLYEVRQLAIARGSGEPNVWPMTLDALTGIYRSWLHLAEQQA